MASELNCKPKVLIKISDPNRCACATDWCKCNVNRWSLDFEFGPNITYVFKFEDTKDATLFALKWVH